MHPAFLQAKQVWLASSNKKSLPKPVAELNRAFAQKGTDMFEIFYKSGTGYWWHLKAANNEILCHSEIFASKQSAQGGISAVQRIVPTAATYDRT